MATPALRGAGRTVLFAIMLALHLTEPGVDDKLFRLVI